MIPPPNLTLNCLHVKQNKRVVAGSFTTVGKPISAVLLVESWLLVLTYECLHPDL